jgi:kynurenine formamidase
MKPQIATLFLVISLTYLSQPISAAAEPARLPQGMKPWWPSRYGASDQLGTLNEITPEVTAKAAKLVKTGAVIDLGRVLDDNTPKFPGRYWHQTADLTPLFTNQRRSDAAGLGWGKNQINWITEIQSGTFQVGTQLDSIGHIQIADRFYNGRTTEEVVEAWGLNHYGIESVPPIVTRGILVDLAGYKGLNRLQKGYVITLSDFLGALNKQKTQIHKGDAVLLHTGWGSLYGVDNTQFLEGEPGAGLGLVGWLYDRHIAITGADTWSYGPVPGEDASRPFLVPQTMYV